MARPRVYTNEQMIAALQETKGLVFLAAQRVGCDPDTIYNRARKSPAVAAAIRNQRGVVVDTAELKLYQAILDGQAWAIALTLKTLGKDRGYVERQEHRDVSDEDLDADIERELEKFAHRRQAPQGGDAAPAALAEPVAPPAGASDVGGGQPG
jgi:hypothetical protein